MFIDNKYTTWYYDIIKRSRSRILDGYIEKHHIIPKSMGGPNSKENIAILTAREHFVCHLLLVQMTENNNRIKMLHAYMMMSGKKLYNSKSYKVLREEYASVNSSLRTGAGNGMFGKDRRGEKNTFFGKSHTEQSKMAISMKKKGRSCNKGILKTQNHKLKLSQSKYKKFRELDTIIYKWCHDTHGTYNMTRSELRDRFPDQNLNISELTKVINPKYAEKSHRGWHIAP